MQYSYYSHWHGLYTYTGEQVVEEMQRNPAYQSLTGQQEDTEDIYDEIEVPEHLSLSSPKAADHVRYSFESHITDRSARKRKLKKYLCLSAVAVSLVFFSVVSILISVSIAISSTARVDSVIKQIEQLKRELANQTQLQVREVTQLYDRLNETQLWTELQARLQDDRISSIQNESASKLAELSTNMSSLITTCKYKPLNDNHRSCFEERRECRIDRGDGLTDYYWRECDTDYIFINKTVSYRKVYTMYHLVPKVNKLLFDTMSILSYIFLVCPSVCLCDGCGRGRNEFAGRVQNHHVRFSFHVHRT